MFRQLAQVGKKALRRCRSRRSPATTLGCRMLQVESLEKRELLSVTFSVTNINDSGAGSLRQAILDANANANGAAADRIEFNIAGAGVHTIQPLSALPAITDPVVIDGYTQPGSSQNTLASGSNAVLAIELDGSLAGAADGLAITAGQSTVQGLVINRFAGNGISVTVGDDNVLQGNFIGTNAAGTADLGNGGYGVLVANGSQRDRVGTDSNGVNDAGERNVISGNSAGGVKIDGFAKTDLAAADTPANAYSALDAYVQAYDPSYSYTLVNTISDTGYTCYNYDMVSQTWNPDNMVIDHAQWHHWLQIIVPVTSALVDTSTAFLVVSGGSNRPDPPTSIDDQIALAAIATGAIVVNVPQIPNESLQFTDEPWDHSEDHLVAYTFDKFLDTGNTAWPIYLPMVKSVIRAMDTAQAVLPGLTGGDVNIENFIMTGFSKRGWATQLATAVDPLSRIKAEIPGVSDLGNLGKQIEYQHEYYEGTTAHTIDGYTDTMDPYLDYHAFDRFNTPNGQALAQIIDPLAYRDRAQLDIPKYYVAAAGDQFFTPGSAEFYIHQMQNHGHTYLRYVPNAGHDLNQDAIIAGIEFYLAARDDSYMPHYDWTIEDGGNTIRMTTQDVPLGVKLWQASNPNSRDYRNYENPPVWTSSTLDPEDLGFDEYVAHVDTPATGSTAFFIEVQYITGTTVLTFSTSISVVSAPDSDVIQGNCIGTNAAGTASIGNSGDGVLILDANSSLVGSNLIAYNSGCGVNIQGTDALASSVLSNTLTSNTGAPLLLQRGNPNSRITVVQQQGNNLVFNGTTGNDTLTLSQPALTAHMGLALNGANLGVFPVATAGSVQVNADAGTDTLVVNGRATNDTITISGANLVVNETTVVGNAVESRLIIGGNGTDTLVGTNADTTWQITGGGSGSLTGNLAFQQIESLTGGSGNDIFQIRDGSLGGTITGGGGTNVLDYSYYTPGLLGDGVSVNLGAGTATSIGGMSGITIAIGSSGNDELRGSEGNDVLIGGAGIDSVLAAGGRDLAVAGSGADSMHTGSGDDILIGGTFSYYNESTKALDIAALNAIMAEWTSGASYSTRVSHLKNGGGLNGSYRLNSSTCWSDSSVDLLYGESNKDWFLGGGADIGMDRDIFTETWTGV